MPLTTGPTLDKLDKKMLSDKEKYIILHVSIYFLFYVSHLHRIKENKCFQLLLISPADQLGGIFLQLQINDVDVFYHKNCLLQLFLFVFSFPFWVFPRL